VEIKELWGLWRLDQQLNEYDDDLVDCQATIELTPKGQVVVFLHTESADKSRDLYSSSPYTFTERMWPKACKIEFVARAFLRPDDPQPLSFMYKGYTYRKVADPKVIKITGSIYRLEKTGWRGKKVQAKPVGTFVARRRMRVNLDSDMSSDNEEDDDDEDEEAVSIVRDDSESDDNGEMFSRINDNDDEYDDDEDAEYREEDTDVEMYEDEEFDGL
jgi:hypothetical protein